MRNRCREQCRCGPYFTSEHTIDTDNDIYWLVLELIRTADGPISRTQLNEQLLDHGVNGQFHIAERDVVDRAIKFWARNTPGRAGVRIEDPTYSFVHGKPARTDQRGRRSLRERLKDVFS